MTYLYDQVERYKQAHELISQTLAIISTLRIDRQLEIEDAVYGHLYYARALVNNGMCYTLANGTLWQKYFIYMPADIVLIMDSVNNDLAHYLFLNKLKQRGDINNNVKVFTEGIIVNSNLDKTLQLSYYIEDKTLLAKALQARYDNIFNCLDLHNQNKNLYRQVTELKTYDIFEKSDISKKFIQQTRDSLEILKNN